MRVFAKLAGGISKNKNDYKLDFLKRVIMSFAWGLNGLLASIRGNLCNNHAGV